MQDIHGAGHRAPECLSDGLVTEANAEDWQIIWSAF